MNATPTLVVFTVYDRKTRSAIYSHEVELECGLPNEYNKILWELNVKTHIVSLVEQEEKYMPVIKRKLSGHDWYVDIEY